MTEEHVLRYFPAKQCLWPVLDDRTIRQLADKPTLSHQEFGYKIRQMLMPKHFTCVRDADLNCTPPKYTGYDPLGRQSCQPDKLIKAKDLCKSDLLDMPEPEAEYKQFMRNRKKSQPFGWWDLQSYTYKY